VAKPCWVGRIVKRSEVQAQGHVIWTDTVALEKIEAIEITKIDQTSAETEVRQTPAVPTQIMSEEIAAKSPRVSPAVAPFSVGTDASAAGVSRVKKDEKNKDDEKENSADPDAVDMDAILGAVLGSSSESESDSERARAGSSPLDLDAMLDLALSDEDDNVDDCKDHASKTTTAIDLDNMLDDMFSEDEDADDYKEDTKYLDGITDSAERKALLLLTAEERKRWRVLLDRDKIRQQAMPPIKPLSKALIKLMAPTSMARKRSEEFSARNHAPDEVFDMIFGRALQEAGVARRGEPVRLNMHPEQLREMREGYKNVFRVGLRDRLVRDVDFDAVRFSDASKAFL
jgi:hypothetical protein